MVLASRAHHAWRGGPPFQGGHPSQAVGLTRGTAAHEAEIEKTLAYTLNRSRLLRQCSRAGQTQTRWVKVETVVRFVQVL